MPTDSLHPDQAQPYYMTIPVEEYEAMKKRKFVNGKWIEEEK